MKQFFLIVIFFFNFSVNAQQAPLFTQYYANNIIINPAVSGSKNYNPLTIQTRQQWLGFEGAPLTTCISYHGALDNRSALGGYLMFDKAYPTMQADMQLNYAYHIPLDYNHINLSFGLGANLSYFNLDFNKEDLPPSEDRAFSSSSYDKTFSDASSGVFLYGHNFYFGFSVANLFQSSFNTPISNSTFPNTKIRNYYLIGAYKFNIINNDWQLEPSFLLRKTKNQISMIDISARVLYLKDSWASLSYRTNGSAVLAFGFRANNIFLSYSYDHMLISEITPNSYGTHELAITFRLETLASMRHISFWEN